MTAPAGRLAGETTSRPGQKTESWWNRGQRALTVEMAYLLLEGPLDVTLDERAFLVALWRHDRRQDWPSDEQWRARFDVDRRTLSRWRKRLTEARMIEFNRPWNIPDGAGGWKGPHKDSGVYTLLPPSQWRYRHGWRYAGADVGWIDGDGVVLNWPASPSSP